MKNKCSTKNEEIPGGTSKGPKDFDKDSLALGTKIEMEHTTDKKIAKEIAMDHLSEDPLYYDKLMAIDPHNADGVKKGKRRYGS